MESASSRRFPAGAEVSPDGGVHFRVWAPKRRRVEVVFEAGGIVELRAEEGGYFSGHAPRARAGADYRLRLDGGEKLFPDPASRFQPRGPHGPSRVIDPQAFRWTDEAWRGATLKGQVIYELHVGTFTPEGTWEAARRELGEMAACGVTCVEMMPVADFPGRFGWGYDGVNLFAPTRLYGEPDDLRRFVDEAHSCGVAVILDVVYNHLGPDGNYLKEFADEYFSERYETEWGEALNFDGLRLDATQQIFDASDEHLLAAVTRRVREAAGRRGTIVVGENEPSYSTRSFAHAREARR